MVSLALSHGVFAYADLQIIQAVYDQITSEPWFSNGSAYRAEFARYVLETYRHGVALPEQLEEVCRATACERFRLSKSEVEGYRFLVVEDDFPIAREAADKLTHLGAHVLGPVPTVGEAMDLIEHGPDIDGALLDVNLNGEMSYPVAALLKMKQIPFAFMSGSDDSVLPAFFRAALVCSKPTDWSTVATILARKRRGVDKGVGRAPILPLAS